MPVDQRGPVLTTKMKENQFQDCTPITGSICVDEIKQKKKKKKPSWKSSQVMSFVYKSMAFPGG